jgi:hypothetical protein
MPSRAATIAAAKQALREDTWARLERARVALFPGARGRIPNFKGAALAADRLGATPEWQRARELKCNPDAPQRPVWFRALREGKRVYMAGSVAVNRAGARVGKGGGYSDLEYAIGREVGCIDGETRIATTVHALPAPWIGGMSATAASRPRPSTTSPSNENDLAGSRGFVIGIKLVRHEGLRKHARLWCFFSSSTNPGLANRRGPFAWQARRWPCSSSRR